MRILITVSTYYPKKDGVQKVTQYLAEGLVKKGHDVTIVTSNKNERINDETYNGVKIKRVDLYTKYGLYFGNKSKYIKLIDEMANNSDAMINVCTQNAFTDLLLKRIGNYKCKKILYLHGIFDFKFHKLDFTSLKSLSNKLWKELRWFLYYNFNGKYFKKYDVVTQLHEKDYGNIYFNKKYNINSVIIENAADDEFFLKKTLKKFEKPFDKYLVLVANYDDRKNQKLAIEQFFKSNIDKSVGLVLIGSKKNNYYIKLEKYIKEIRKKYGLSETEKPIKMLYNVEREYISSYVSNAYLYIMSSKWEAYPISLVEAMASGVPFISTNVGIVKYFYGGIVSEPDEISYWIEELVENKTIRDKLSDVCRTYAVQKLKINDKVDLLIKNIEK